MDCIPAEQCRSSIMAYPDSLLLFVHSLWRRLSVTFSLFEDDEYCGCIWNFLCGKIRCLIWITVECWREITFYTSKGSAATHNMRWAIMFRFLQHIVSPMSTKTYLNQLVFQGVIQNMKRAAFWNTLHMAQERNKVIKKTILTEALADGIAIFIVSLRAYNIQKVAFSQFMKCTWLFHFTIFLKITFTPFLFHS